MSGCSLRDGVAPHRHRTTWLVLGAVLLVLVACSTRSGDGPGTPSGLTIWQLWHPDLIAPIVDRFVFEHPGIRVRVEQIDWAEAPARLAAALAAGEAPDLCELSSTWVPRFTAGGHLADLTRAASPMAAPAPAWDAVTVGGRVRALPWLASSRLLAVHRGLLDDAGPMPGSSPETWDDLLAAAGRIDSLDASIHGFGIPADAPHLLHRLLLTFAAGNGGRVLSADGQHAVVDSLPVVDALELLVGLSAHALRAPLAELELALAEGRLGMLIVDAASLQRVLTAAPDLDVEVAPVPRPRAYLGSHASFADLTVIAVLDASPRVDAAIELARALIEPANMRRFCHMAEIVQPALPLPVGNPERAAHPRETRFAAAVAGSQMAPAHPQWPEMAEVLDAAVDEALDGDAPPRQALERAARRIQRLLAGPPAEPGP